MDPSRENDAAGTQASVVVLIISSPAQSPAFEPPPFKSPPLKLDSVGRPDSGMTAYSALPSTFATTAMWSVDIHASDDGDALIPGVRLRVAPPAIGTT